MKKIFVFMNICASLVLASCGTINPELVSSTEKREEIESQKSAIAERIEQSECNPTYGSCK